MKKLSSIILATLSFLLLGVSLTSCYISNPAPMKDLVGTFLLTKYTRTYSESDANGESTSTTHNMIEEKGITCYLVVKDDGYGYFIYKDNETSLYCETIRIEYTYDSDETGKISRIDYTNGSNLSGDGYPGKGKEALGLNFKTFKKKLEFTMPSIFGRKYSQSVEYIKKSKDSTLDFVSKKLGATISAQPYEYKNLTGKYSLEYFDNYRYVYLDLNIESKKASVYYRVLNTEDDLSLLNQDVTCTIEKGQNGDVLVMRVGDFSFKRPMLAVLQAPQFVGSELDFILNSTELSASEFIATIQ